MRFLIFELSRLFIKNSRPEENHIEMVWPFDWFYDILSTLGLWKKDAKILFLVRLNARRFSLVDVLFGASFSFLLFFLHRL